MKKNSQKVRNPYSIAQLLTWDLSLSLTLGPIVGRLNRAFVTGVAWDITHLFRSGKHRFFALSLIIFNTSSHLRPT